MTMICTPEYLDRAAKENPDMTFIEYIAMLQTGRLTEEQEEMTLEEAREFAQMERDRIDLEYDMTHQ